MLTSRKTLAIDILPQPTETTCGPTCLHAIYNYFNDPIELDQIMKEVPVLDDGGGTFGAFLGTHALKRGYRSTLYTYNLKVFDPTWFMPPRPDILEKLRLQAEYKKQKRFAAASAAYENFLRAGGRLEFTDLTSRLIITYLKASIPIIVGLSAPYLYRTAREIGETMELDDIRGTPSGHFVVLYGYDKTTREIYLADPLKPNPFSRSQRYAVHVARLINAILLGILTNDANLLVIEPMEERTRHPHSAAPRRKGAS